MTDLTFNIPHGTVIGKVHVDKHLEHRVTCEYAAWGHTIKGDMGRFDLYLGNTNQGGIYKTALFAKIPGTVSSSYYAAHFGGVAVGSRGVDEMVGQRESFTHRVNFDDVFADHQISINPEFVETVIKTVTEFINNAVAYHQASMTCLTDKLLTPCNHQGVVGEFDGQYDRYQAGHAAYHAEHIVKLLRLMEKIVGYNSNKAMDEIINSWVTRFTKNISQWNSNDRYNKIDTTKNIQADIKSVA